MMADSWGRVRPEYDVRGMSYPVLCNHCGKTYDLTNTEHIARYADCDMFKSPCCKRVVDTRPWKSLPDYQRLTRNGELR